MRRDVFQAIADPTRREIIHLLAQQPRNLNHLADHFTISRPAVSQQIKILTECGLITVHQRGRERYCEANVQKLQEVTSWIDQCRRFWTGKPDALGQYLDATQESTSASVSTHKKSKKI